jgi:hypothetical protein
VTIEDLQLISSSVKLESNSDNTDEIAVDYTVHSDGAMARLVRWHCTCPTDDGMISVAEATYRVSFATDAAFEIILESKMLEITWPYFRQLVLTSVFLSERKSEIMLPIEIFINTNKSNPSKNGLEIANLSNDETLSVKKFWEDQYTESTRISLKFMRILLEIQEKKREWLISLVRLLIYLKVIEFSDFCTIPVYFGVSNLKSASDILNREFGFDDTEFLQINDDDKKFLLSIIENMIVNSLTAVVVSDCDPGTSEISDNFDIGVEDILNYPVIEYVKIKFLPRNLIQ